MGHILDHELRCTAPELGQERKPDVCAFTQFDVFGSGLARFEGTSGPPPTDCAEISKMLPPYQIGTAPYQRSTAEYQIGRGYYHIGSVPYQFSAAYPTNLVGGDTNLNFRGFRGPKPPK